jgi:uncharacterized protein YeaO (DUF488 family)
MIRIKRIYDPVRRPAATECGLIGCGRTRSTSRTQLDGRLREIAPSAGLCTWSRHDPARWGVGERYRQEFATAASTARLEELRTPGPRSDTHERGSIQ